MAWNINYFGLFVTHNLRIHRLPYAVICIQRPLTALQFSKLRSKYVDHKESITTSDPNSERNVEIRQLFNIINRTIPNVTVTHTDQATSAKKSRTTILNHRLKYCVGESLTVQVDMFDYLGQRKTHGGDFLRSRIYSLNDKAGASGRIEDCNNGTYLIHFTLFWEGHVKISIQLFHPSEGVSALWRTRNMGYKYINFTGKFLNKTKEVHRECGFYLDSTEEKCEYADKRNEEFFYCIKPPDVPCESLVSLKSKNSPHTYLSKLEKETYVNVTSKCTIGKSSPFPSGYFLNNTWHPLFCNLSSFGPLSQIDKCLSGKMIYLMGDSTIRQWIQAFTNLMKNLTFFDLHGNGWHRKFLALDMERNIYIQWKKHGHPFVTHSFFTVKDHAYTSHQIDQIAGGSYTVIVISLGQHFRPFPIFLFIRRILNIRKAIERLFLRSPDTKVIIKSENTREINPDAERFSDFHGYIQYLLVKDIFKGLNVGMIDAWDMTTAFGSLDTHPVIDIIKNQINMFLAYICEF
ncbi:NXPE family member 1-like [Discoglossus pictus]